MLQRFTGVSRLSVIVSNTLGSFALFGLDSRFEGVFFTRGKQTFRTIAHIEGSGECGDFSTEFWRARYKHGAFRSLWFAKRLPIFFFESKGSYDVLLDCRENYDNRVWGRHYDVFEEEGMVYVHYEKRDDDREPVKGEYDFWLAFAGIDAGLSLEWVERNYSFDKERSSPPFSRWVFRAFRAKGSFVCAFGSSKWEVSRLAREGVERRLHLMREARVFSDDVVSRARFNWQSRACAYSLLCLRSSDGLFAGLPWFHQRWARDELISLKSFARVGQVELSKAILFSWLDKLSGVKMEGTLTRFIADSGWVFVRANDLWDFLSPSERLEVADRARNFCKSVSESLSSGLLFSGSKETWMDSLDRSGARVEIQALALSAFKLLRERGYSSKHLDSLEYDFKDSVVSSFWNGNYLKDGCDDPAIRPNLFIAAYVYPELLTKAQWRKCFSTALSRLWCEWGGLATIDVKSASFIGRHTGEDPASYHQGDSWYWLNNLSAIVLLSLGSSAQKRYAESIFNASSKEILQGALGHHAELSSAESLESRGCLAQAWSAAMYLELCELLKG
ncbi:hypothetical protein D6825_03405 [Candidatus Woesearchaeota archaeon]|nr:MAG: hypothetical protein D6825_03405 [Candidatus Woesearchaeota archaeon]